jgi:hypothetical protein
LERFRSFLIKKGKTRGIGRSDSCEREGYLRGGRGKKNEGEERGNIISTCLSK